MSVEVGPSIAPTVCEPGELSPAERGEAFALLCRHFDGVTREQFERDLSEKNAILTLRDAAGGALLGFSTMLVYETRVEGAPVSVVCSGDTIVDPSAWNSSALPREWIAAVNRLRERYPRGPYYWLLITSGFRTYRLLSTFWRSFYPRHDTPTPPDQQRLLDALAAERFGGTYDATSGIVRLARPQVLRPHLAGVPPERLADRHVAFFAARNPGHARGDELACLCALDESNLTRAGRRMVFGAGDRAMTLLSTAANAAWLLANLPAHAAFARALDDPRAAQQQLLRDYVRRNASSDFGRRHGYDRIDSVTAFQRAVPVRGYDELAGDIDRVAAGEANVLTAEPVLRLATSSGSTRGRKLIPQTATLQREFNRAIGPWIADLYQSDPSLMCGSAYWSITPAMPRPADASRPAGAPAIGFAEDSAYLGGWRKRLVDAVMAVPGEVARIADVDAFRFATLRHLLSRRDLRLISVWHPSFLELLLDAAARDWDALVEAVAVTNWRRATELRDAGPGAWDRVWPRLALVSCWADAHAAGPADALRRRLPHVRFQAKGLLATEAFVTIPFAGARPLAVRSHFFEFVDDDGRARLAGELRVGARYAVVVTTGGGLWRYRLGDRVEVDGFVGRTPSLRFVGRDDHVVDRFGEKLSEGFVGDAIRGTLAAAGIDAPFAMLAPDATDRYALFIEADGSSLGGLSSRLDDALCANPHYAYCRRLGQIRAAAVFIIDGDAYVAYADELRGAGMRLGDIKPTSLSARDTWPAVFRGYYLDAAAQQAPEASPRCSAATAIS